MPFPLSVPKLTPTSSFSSFRYAGNGFSWELVQAVTSLNVPAIWFLKDPTLYLHKTSKNIQINVGNKRNDFRECDEHHLHLQSLMRKIQDDGLDIQTTRNSDHFGAVIHHLSLIRNKRCLMAYTYNRA
ncbi:uncharacterized protein LOC116249882 [Nymphaea colorata]|nr:uncharacterized protein LOC116249882 [Nymphaea colorata]